MDLLLACLLLFYWRSFAARRATMLRKRRRLMEVQRRLGAVQRRLRRQRILMTLVLAVRGSYYSVERRFWVSSSRYLYYIALFILYCDEQMHAANS